MSVSYTCPDPDCGVMLKTPNRVAVGKSVKCPKCGKPFVPETAGLSAGDPPPPSASVAPAAAKSRFADDDEDSDESVKRGYGVLKDSEAEIKEAKKNRPTFTEVQDKFKKSARGPAQALLVMPSNLLLGAGMIVCAASVVFFIIGMWPLVFNDAPPGEEELDEAVFSMLMGLLGFVWGGIICYGASQMQELGSYIFAMLGAIMGVPLLVGIFALIMLQNPRVKAGFLEAEAGPDELDKDDEEEDEDEDAEPGARKKKKESDNSRRAKKAAGVLGGMLLGAVLGDEEGEDGGDEDYEDEEEEEEDEEVEDDEDEEEVEEDEEDEEEVEEEDRKRSKKKKRR